jgi:hypothetical protein
MEVINWRIVSHPLNWLTLFLMVFIAGIAIHFVLTLFGQKSQAEKQATAA